MALRICAVFHSDKQDGAAGKPPAVAVNPPMTMGGMEKIDGLVAKIKSDPRLGVEDSLNRDLDVMTVKGLSPMANQEDGKVIKYPGHELEGPVEWQLNATEAIDEIAGTDFCQPDNCGGRTGTIIIVSHRSIIAGLVAEARGIIGDGEALYRLIKDPNLVKDGHIVLDYSPVDGEFSEIPL